MSRPDEGSNPRAPRRGGWGTVLGGGVAYFAVVFACGFLLGVGRTLWLVPRIGERWAELVEIPVMLGVIGVAAQWVSRRFGLEGRGRAVRAGVGLLALGWMLAAEFGVVLQLRGLSLAEYLEQRDPVSGTAYALSLVVFGLAPLLVSRGERSR